MFPCLKACTKTNLPKKQPTIENQTENKTDSLLVKYDPDSLFSTQERYMIKHDQEVFKNFDSEKNLSDYENGVGKLVVKSRLRKNLITGRLTQMPLTLRSLLRPSRLSLCSLMSRSPLYLICPVI